jgi:glycosidase
MINFIDNHDKKRFMSEQNATQYNYWLSLMYLFTTKGIPCVYYNTENDVSGDMDTGRLDMPDFKTTGKKTFTLIRKLAKIRSENISLRRGDMTVLKDSSGPGVFAFRRFNGTAAEDIVVILNSSTSGINVSIDVSGFLTDSSVMKNILYEEFGLTNDVTVKSGKLSTSVEASSMKIFKLKT